MIYQIYKPQPALAAYVKHYWILEMDARMAAGIPQRVVPGASIEMIFYLGDEIQRKGLSEIPPASAFLCGQKNTYFDLVPGGRVKILAVVFYPHTAAAFFHLPMNELFNQSLPLEIIAGEKGRIVTEKISETSDVVNGIKVIEDFLCQQLETKRQYEFKRLMNSIRQINNSKGLAGVGALAAIACLSRKQYERTFSAFVGMSPKQFMRVVRFQHTIFSQHHRPSDSLTSLAYDCGYYDQSHLINEFKQLTGLTPGQYFSDCKFSSDYFD